MAYATLVSLERTLEQALNHDRFSISPDETKHIISLDKCVISFQAFLEYFPEKANNLEARIRDVAAEAQDIIEWFMSDQIQYGYVNTDWIAILRRIKFRYQLHKVSNEMESIFGVVVETKSSIPVKDTQLGVRYFPVTASASQVADTGKTVMVDPNKDLVEINARLCGEARQLQVLPICGMGGIGKTTLARNAYHDPLIMEHFQVRAWLTISQDYSARRILVELLDSMKELDPEQSNEKMAERSKHGNVFGAGISEQITSKTAERFELSNSELKLKVHKILIGRRYLIVMDDMWSTKVLDDIRNFLPDDKNGSRIMLTTRMMDVATYANSSMPYHEMRLMDEHQSWTLLQ